MGDDTKAQFQQDLHNTVNALVSLRKKGEEMLEEVLKRIEEASLIDDSTLEELILFEPRKNCSYQCVNFLMLPVVEVDICCHVGQRDVVKVA